MTHDLEAQARRRTRRFLALAATAVVVLLLVAVGVGVWLGGHGNSPVAQPTAPTTRPSPIATASPVPTTAASRGLDDVMWVELNSFPLPVSRESGPRDLADGRAQGFARNRDGAVLGAAHLLARVAPEMGSRIFRPTLREQVVGVDAGRLADRVESQYIDLQQSAGISDGGTVPVYSQLVAYRVEQFTAQSAAVHLVIEGNGQGGVVRIDARVEVEWSGGDWKLIAPPNGRWEGVSNQVSSLDPYTLLPRRR